MGQVFNLEEDSIGAVIFGNYLKIKEGDIVKSTGRLLEVPVGDAVIGRVLSPRGVPIDGGPPINTVPTSDTSTCCLNSAISFFRMLVISATLMAIVYPLCRF